MSWLTGSGFSVVPIPWRTRLITASSAAIMTATTFSSLIHPSGTSSILLPLDTVPARPSGVTPIAAARYATVSA